MLGLECLPTKELSVSLVLFRMLRVATPCILKTAYFSHQLPIIEKSNNKQLKCKH